MPVPPLRKCTWNWGNKAEAAAAAKQGVALLRQAVPQKPDDAEYRRLLGTLCGQVIPASPLSAFSFGRCALDEIETALRLNPRLAEAYLSRGVGNYYLPPAFGGGLEKAERDVAHAIELSPTSPDAHLWMGLILRRQGKLEKAREHLDTAARLAPDRDWIKSQLAKTPLPASPSKH
jgi:tetratricopeptide (TPR) repeat protein